MDTVKFLKTINRMCNNYGSSCNGCPISIEIQRDGDYLGCYSFIKLYPEKVVKIVEEWEKEHPVKTRQSEFLKKYPNARLNSKGVLDIRPCSIDISYSTDNCYFACGDECQNAYWSQEVEE